jgi:hypothetical protein
MQCDGALPASAVNPIICSDLVGKPDNGAHHSIQLQAHFAMGKSKSCPYQQCSYETPTVGKHESVIRGIRRRFVWFVTPEAMETYGVRAQPELVLGKFGLRHLSRLKICAVLEKHARNFRISPERHQM